MLRILKTTRSYIINSNFVDLIYIASDYIQRQVLRYERYKFHYNRLSNQSTYRITGQPANQQTDIRAQREVILTINNARDNEAY